MSKKVISLTFLQVKFNDCHLIIHIAVVPKDKKSSDFMLAVLETLKEHALFAEDDEQYLNLKVSRNLAFGLKSLG